MKHLAPDEFVDYVEGALPPSRAQHVDACERCAAEAASMRAMLQSAQVDAPDPSPLFWDHFPARVRRAMASEVPPTAGWRGRIAVLAWSVAIVALTVIAFRAAQHVVPAPAAGTLAESLTPTIADARGDQDDEAFQVLTEAAADIKVEDAHAAGLAVAPTAVDKAVLELTPSEREELGRLLQDERKRAGI